MANKLQCNFCDKPATVHLTQIMNGKVQKLDLCEECAQKKGVEDTQGFSLQDLLAKTVGSFSEGLASAPGDPTLALKCPHCGFTPNKLQETGRLGCPECYGEFSAYIVPTLAGMHKNTVHTGKVPHRSLERQDLFSRIQRLQDELQQAVDDERYEDAARLRDEIRNWKERTPGEVDHAD